MSNLFHYFSSFDKLMKEKLVAPLFWLALLYVGLNLLATFFDETGIGFIEVLKEPIELITPIVGLLTAAVAIRVLCELAVAIFRINDNLSPDKGVSETADIDPVAEARRAAEDAARRARLATDSAVESTRNATRRAVASTKATVARAAEKTEDAFEDMGDAIGNKADAVKAKVASRTNNIDDDIDDAVLDADADLPPIAATRPAGKVSAKKAGRATATKAAPASKTVSSDAPRRRGRPKGSKNVVRIDPKTGQRLKKDGTPAKKPGPKTSGTAKPAAKKSTSTTPRKRGRPKGSKNVVRIDPVTGVRLKKDGTPAKKPGPKPKS